MLKLSLKKSSLLSFVILPPSPSCCESKLEQLYRDKRYGRGISAIKIFVVPSVLITLWFCKWQNQEYSGCAHDVVEAYKHFNTLFI